MNRERIIGLVCLFILAVVVTLGAVEANKPQPEVCVEVTLGGEPWLKLC
jgi:hypothetical protein